MLHSTIFGLLLMHKITTFVNRQTGLCFSFNDSEKVNYLTTYYNYYYCLPKYGISFM